VSTCFSSSAKSTSTLCYGSRIMVCNDGTCGRKEDTGKWHAPTLASRSHGYLSPERGQFASLASHDLREPLRTVNNYVRSSGDSAAMSQKPRLNQMPGCLLMRSLSSRSWPVARVRIIMSSTISPPSVPHRYDNGGEPTSPAVGGAVRERRAPAAHGRPCHGFKSGNLLEPASISPRVLLVCSFS